ncbi:MAG: ferredoxin [Sciscionella sp.]
MKVTVDRNVCVGAGNCVLTAPEIFDQSEEDGTVVLLDATPGDERRIEIEEAAAACPSGAISVQAD